MSEKESLVVTSKTKAYIKEKGCMVGGDVLDALNDKVRELLDKAVKRAKDNKRSTLRSQDL